ncbi:MAG: hypothetical protein AAF546_13175 [Verrucomicrobiota bacterium]
MRLINIFFAILISLVLGGCAAVEKGTTYNKVKDQLLVADSGLGAKRLEIESRYDPTVKGFLQAAGEPDYIYVESQYQLLLIYLNEDYVAEFNRPFYTTNSEVTKKTGIPNHLFEMIDHAKAHPSQEAFSFSD